MCLEGLRQRLHAYYHRLRHGRVQTNFRPMQDQGCLCRNAYACYLPQKLSPINIRCAQHQDTQPHRNPWITSEHRPITLSPSYYC